ASSRSSGSLMPVAVDCDEGRKRLRFAKTIRRTPPARHTLARPSLLARQADRQRRWPFHRRDAALHRLAHLFTGPQLDLAYALAGHTEFSGEHVEGDPALGEPRASRMRRSRALSTESAEASALRRLSSPFCETLLQDLYGA